VSGPCGVALLAEEPNCVTARWNDVKPGNLSGASRVRKLSGVKGDGEGLFNTESGPAKFFILFEIPEEVPHVAVALGRALEAAEAPLKVGGDVRNIPVATVVAEESVAKGREIRSSKAGPGGSGCEFLLEGSRVPPCFIYVVYTDTCHVGPRANDGPG